MNSNATMEQFKGVCRRRIIMCGGIMMFLGGAMIVGGGSGMLSGTGVPADDFYSGMLTGAICAGIVIAAVCIVKILLCLRSEETLRAAYVKENDERQCAVWQKAALTGWRSSSILLLVVGLAAGYWSLPVSLSLMGAAAFSCVCVKAAQVFYNKSL